MAKITFTVEVKDGDDAFLVHEMLQAIGLTMNGIAGIEHFSLNMEDNQGSLVDHIVLPDSQGK